jgi:hypothetical protein
MSEPQQLNQKVPPENWCVIFAEANEGQYIHKLGKWSGPRLSWLDETLCPIKSSHIFSIYQETRFKNIAQIENEMYAK